MPRARIALLFTLILGLVLSGCRSLHLEAAFSQPEELTATAQAEAIPAAPPPTNNAPDVAAPTVPPPTLRPTASPVFTLAPTPATQPTAPPAPTTSAPPTATATPTPWMVAETPDLTRVPLVPSCPTERRIAFVSDRDGNEEIYVLDCSSVELRQTRLTHNPARDTCPAWSPDGRRIAFYSERDGNWEIYVMDADGQGLMNLTNNAAKDGELESVVRVRCHPPAWSPDGTQLAFVSNRDGNPEIYVMNSDGSGQRNLTNDPAEDTYPAWSPDGSRIAFVSDRTGEHEIYVMDADGSYLANLTQDLYPDYDQQSWAYQPAWSPDGTRIAFAGWGWKEATPPSSLYYNMVFVMNADGSDKHKVTSYPCGGWRSPTWSPDGQKLAVLDHCPSQPGLMRMRVVDIESGEERLVAEYDGYSDSICWLPDGKRIVFARPTSVTGRGGSAGYRVAGHEICVTDPMLELTHIPEAEEGRAVPMGDFMPAVQP